MLIAIFLAVKHVSFHIAANSYAHFLTNNFLKFNNIMKYLHYVNRATLWSSLKKASRNQMVYIRV